MASGVQGERATGRPASARPWASRITLQRNAYASLFVMARVTSTAETICWSRLVDRQHVGADRHVPGQPLRHVFLQANHPCDYRCLAAPWPLNWEPRVPLTPGVHGNGLPGLQRYGQITPFDVLLGTHEKGRLSILQQKSLSFASTGSTPASRGRTAD